MTHRSACPPARLLPLLPALLLAGCTTQAPPASMAGAMACPVDVSAVVYPHPAYPEYEAMNGYEDQCLVRFDIDEAGVPVNPEARCTYKAFARSAEAAIVKARFDREEAGALPAGAQCAAFNIEYSLEPVPGPL